MKKIRLFFAPFLQQTYVIRVHFFLINLVFQKRERTNGQAYEFSIIYLRSYLKNKKICYFTMSAFFSMQIYIFFYLHSKHLIYCCKQNIYQIYVIKNLMHKKQISFLIIYILIHKLNLKKNIILLFGRFFFYKWF